ncbi:MAG: type II toxin-antitoxin system YafQ family toxin [bacterium]|nr:type II toxin-antitoxin system YafQ family toxin [bacterium]
MRRTRPLGPFKKDLKRLSRRGWNIGRLHDLILLIQKDEQLPLSARPHKLSGKYAGLWESHIESDWLLIYNITEEKVLLVRTGTHADLFE